MIERYCVILMMLLLSVPSLSAQEHIPTDSLGLRINFRQGYRYVDASFRDNRTALDSLIAVIRRAQADGSLSSIDVQAWASPEGGNSFNEKLAAARTAQVAAYIKRHVSLPAGLIKQTSGGIGWHLLREQVAASDLSHRNEILHIIDHTPIWVRNAQGRIISSRKQQLMNLEGGKPWKEMYNRFFPDIRCCLAVVVTFRRTEPMVAVKACEQPVTVAMSKALPTSLTITPMVHVPSGYADNSFCMLLKTNLLYDVALIPNIGIECYLGRGWSVGGNWMYAWWKNDRKHDYWRIYGGELYARKYFGRRAKAEALQGHHLGLYVQALTYDFETGGKGIMGGVPGGTIFDKLNYGVGLEYGYSLPIARRLNLDFSIGVGYLGGEYQEYRPQDDCYVWQATKQRHWFGPTKAEVALGWLIGKENRNVKKGGKR